MRAGSVNARSLGWIAPSGSAERLSLSGTKIPRRHLPHGRRSIAPLPGATSAWRASQSLSRLCEFGWCHTFEIAEIAPTETFDFLAGQVSPHKTQFTDTPCFDSLQSARVEPD